MTEMTIGELSARFDEARALGVGFYLGYAELTPEGRAVLARLVAARREQWEKLGPRQ